MRIPAGLLAACRLVEGAKDGLFREEDGGWIWDPFAMQVRAPGRIICLINGRGG
jgi:hypothetical protein